MASSYQSVAQRGTTATHEPHDQQLSTDGSTARRISPPERRRCDINLRLPSHGVIDHVKFSLLWPLAGLDRERLSSVGFNHERVKMRAKRGPDGSVFDPEDGAELLRRESDGARVAVWPTRVAVIASLSRVLGLSNDRLHELSESDAVTATRQMTTELLPWTSCRAALRGYDWGLIEWSLAIDVRADARHFASAYRSAKWGRVRSLPQLYRGRSLAWQGTDSRLTLYDKGQEMFEHGTPGGPSPGEVMRVERQWRGAAAMTRVSHDLATATGPSLRFVERRNDGRVVALPRSIGHRALHGVLARELTLLDQPIPVGVSRLDVIAQHMNECPRFFEMMRESADPKTFRGYRQRMLAHRLEPTGGRTLLEVCYEAA